MNNLLSFASVMRSIGGVALAIIILLAMVTIHEFGHYIAGRKLGFKIDEFAVGFGPAILKKRSKKTGILFALRVIPLGGYCAFDGEDEYEDEKQTTQTKEEKEEPFSELSAPVEKQKDEDRDALSEEKADEYPQPIGEKFNDQPPWKRIIVLLAGATMNYLLALALIVIMFTCIGRPFYKIDKLSTEVNNGFQVGDVITEIDDEDVYMITDYLDILQGKKAGEKIEVSVIRDGREMEFDMTLLEDTNFANMSDTRKAFRAMGIVEIDTTTEKQGLFDGVGQSVVYSLKIGGTVLRSLGELLTGKLGMDAVGGPFTTIQVTSKVASSGVFSFLDIASFIGVNLAVFNLLPIPALDGSKVIFCIIEWIRKKPINRKVETMIHFIGIIFLFGFAILVDILHLFI